ncbi:MAG TPA: PEP-CTERM sorting domain-containing protein [Pyrinomonadaceae bacterium]|nr:PEP-CTERM sorting domain-containing protein [Pyrinomonadaceae bacterium]
MKRLVLLFAAAIVFGLPTAVSADVITFQAPSNAPNQGNGGPNQFNLDHHDAYTWRIGGVDLTGKAITSATLTFHNISNWDRNPNMLFIHLLDTAKSFSTASGTRSATVNGVTSFQDAPANQVPVTDINDDFAGTRYLNNPLVDANTANTFLTQQSFTTTPGDFVYTFTADQLNILSAYFLNGSDIAFGFDPDCHFWNNGITFSFTTAPTATPEPATLALLGTGLAGLYYRRRRQQQKARLIN